MYMRTHKYIDNAHFVVYSSNIFAYGHIHIFHALWKLSACEKRRQFIDTISATIGKTHFFGEKSFPNFHFEEIHVEKSDLE